MGRFERKVPLREPVSVVDQHKAGSMFESFRLALHGELVLADEDAAKDVEDMFRKGEPGKDIPRGGEFDTRAVGIDWDNDGAIGEPVVANANLLHADIRQGEFARGADRISIEAQQLVGSAVGGRSVRRDENAHGDWLEGLLLFVNAGAFP